MADKDDDKSKGKNGNKGTDDKKNASDKEVAELVKAQAERIKQLETEAATHTGLKDEVTKLQEALGTQTSLTELVDQLKTMNAAGNEAPTEAEKQASALQAAADAGDMKEFRRLRTEQQA